MATRPRGRAGSTTARTALESTVIYSLVWEYRQRWRAPLGPDGVESEGFAFVEGRVTGCIEGRFRGGNSARQRSDGRFLTDVNGVILGEDGLVVSVDYQGVCCPYPRSAEPLEDRTRVTIAARHQTADPRWQHLNDTVCLGIGENRFTEDGTRLALFDVHEIVWAPLSTRATARPTDGVVTIDDDPFDLAQLRGQREQT